MQNQSENDLESGRSDDRIEDTAPQRPVRHDDRGRRSPGRTGAGSIPIYIWFLGLIVVLMVMAVAGLWGLYLMRGQWTTAGPTPTPIVWTPTPMPEAPATATPTSEPEPEEIVPTVSPDIAIGGYVRVSGTGGSGLNLRQGPGANYARKDTALEGEVFIVSAGPTESAGVVWWKLRDPRDEERDWWGAANFLEPVPPP